MRSGFSLLELSVVLTIIALIIGGLIMGKDMMRAAELNSLVQDVQKYKTAVEQFEFKYQVLPGDMPDAASYWSECIDFTFPNSCNGDGDSYVNSGNETKRAFEHLSHARILKESINSTDIGTDSSPDYFFETDAFKTLVRIHDTNGDGFWPDSKYPHYTVTIDMGDNPNYPATDFIQLDTKFDDGLPLTGQIRIYQDELNTTTGCVDAVDTTAQWNYNGDSNFCHLYFLPN